MRKHYMAFVPSTPEQRPAGPAAASMEFLRKRLESPEVQERLKGALFERQGGIHILVDKLLNEEERNNKQDEYPKEDQ